MSDITRIDRQDCNWNKTKKTPFVTAVEKMRVTLLRLTQQTDSFLYSSSGFFTNYVSQRVEFHIFFLPFFLSLYIYTIWIEDFGVLLRLEWKPKKSPPSTPRRRRRKTPPSRIHSHQELSK